MSVMYKERHSQRYPHLAVTQPKYEKPLTKYGTIYKNYLKETQPGRYAVLMVNLELMKICHEKEDEANQYEGTVLSLLRRENPPPNRDDTKGMIQYNNWLYKTAEDMTIEDIIHHRH